MDRASITCADLKYALYRSFLYFCLSACERVDTCFGTCQPNDTPTHFSYPLRGVLFRLLPVVQQSIGDGAFLSCTSLKIRATGPSIKPVVSTRVVVSLVDGIYLPTLFTAWRVCSKNLQVRYFLEMQVKEI